MIRRGKKGRKINFTHAFFGGNNQCERVEKLLKTAVIWFNTAVFWSGILAR